MHTMNGVLAEHDKMRGHKENSILSSIYILLFLSTLDDILSNQLNTKHYNSTRLDGTSTNYTSEGSVSISTCNSQFSITDSKFEYKKIIRMRIQHI